MPAEADTHAITQRVVSPPSQAASETRAWLGQRPRDPVAEDLVLQRLESRLLGRQPAAVMLARYVLLERIGVGGLGSVYAAYDPQLDRKVAIKLLHDVGDPTGGPMRLLREGQALARLAHPNVVAVHDVGVVEGIADDGEARLFVAMELIDGLTLSQWLAEQPRSWSEIRDVLVQAGRGLEAAHAAALVHRDFKPANVLVGRDGRVRVLDFGLARGIEAHDDGARSSSSALSSTITAAGTLMGTPAYMAPEQIAGAGVGPHSDQFSFCVTAYEALFGTRPFGSGDVVQTLAAVQRCEPAPPPVDSQVPAWLSSAVMRGLCRDPAARFAGIAELLDAMTEDRRARRRRRYRGAIVTMVLALLVLAVLFATRPEPTPQELAIVERLTEEARAAAARSYFVIPPLDDPDAATAYRKVRELETQTGAIAALADARAQELRSELAATLVALADDYAARDGGAGFASDFYAAALVFEPEHAHARAGTTLSPGELHALVVQADSGGFSKAERVAGETLAVLADAHGERRAARARALIDRDDGPSPSTEARLRRLAIDPEPAPPRPTTRVAKVELETSPPAIPPARPVESDATPASAPTIAKASTREDADALVAEAARARKSGDAAAAERFLHRALRVDRDHSAALAALAHAHFEAAQYHSAIRFAQRAVATAPRKADYRIVLGDAHFRVLAYDAAREQYERALELGHPSARKRLALLDERVGGDRTP